MSTTVLFRALRAASAHAASAHIAAHRRFYTLAVVLLLLFGGDIFAQPTTAQNRSSRGRDFFMTFMPNVHDISSGRSSVSDSLYIYITSDVPTSGRIRFRSSTGADSVRSFRISNPNEVFIFRIGFQNFELRGFFLGGRGANGAAAIDLVNAQSERIAPQYFRVTADNDVTVYGLNQALFTSDAFLALPSTSLGQEYVVLSYKSDARGASFNPNDPNEISTPSQFAIVATDNGTEVRIEPSAPTLLAQSTAPQIVRMNQGDSYLVQADPRSRQGFADLTGSRIRANKPIAVFAGHQRATIPVEERGNPFRTRDHLVEQLPSLETWGKSAFVTPFIRAQGEIDGNDKFRVLAAYDSTRVFFNGQFVRTLAAGEHFEENLINPGRITASDQILVAQYKKTSSPRDGNDFRGDPFMIVIPTVEQYDNSYRVVNVSATDISLPAPTGGQVFEFHYVTIVAPNATLDNIRFDETLIGRNRFTPIPTSAFSYVNIPTSAGTHTARADSAFGVYVYGYGVLNSYGYVGGGKLRIIAPDRNEPLIVSRDSCFGLGGIVFDTLATDSRIASVQAENLQNVNVNIASFRPFADSVRFSATLQNTLSDGSFTLVARDSAGFVARRAFFIPGATVALQGVGASAQIPERRFTLDIGRSRVFRFVIENYGTTTQTVSNFARSIVTNTANAVVVPTLGPLPMVLRPNGRDTLFVRVEAAQQGTFVAEFAVLNGCLTRTILRLVIDVGRDTTPPTIASTVDNCARLVSLRIADSEPYLSGVRTVQALGQLINCTLQIDPITSANAQDVRARLNILNPRRDAIYALQVIDSAGNERVVRDTVQGFTLELVPALPPAAQTGAFGAIEITRLECQTLTYRNVGTKPFVIERLTPRRNLWFSIPESQFPFIVPPNGATRQLTLCFSPLVQQQYRDSLVIDAFCVQDVLPLSGEGKPLLRLDTGRCEVVIRLTTNSAPRSYFMEQNFPNPSANFTSFNLGLAESSLVKISIFNALGTLIDTPLHGILSKGVHDVQVNTSRLESGVYFYVLEANGEKIVRQMSVIK
ncbi:MAG: T9SS C-terminal target domain-containing protein [Candidatus Kapaibacterium sp.]|nr:MAG: T9SS C-terminal target domain-containing protein [Candidatus Kapabacteria bacterium]